MVLLRGNHRYRSQERLRKLAIDEAHKANAMYRDDIADWINGNPPPLPQHI